MTRSSLLNACLLGSLLNLAVLPPYTSALQLDEKSDLIKRLTARDTEDLVVSKRASTTNQCSVPSNQRCDGHGDCGDESDEHNCANFICPRGKHKCANNLQCVHDWEICNALSDHPPACNDSSDETNCENKNCAHQWEKCDDNRQCVHETVKCDGHAGDCNDQSDEVNCESHQCAPVMWKCANNLKCVYKHSVCDGTANCDDRSDERQCENWNCTSGRKCNDNRQCVSRSRFCDGFTDCSDGTDEECATWQTDGATGKEYIVIDNKRSVDYETSTAVCRAVLGNLPEPMTQAENNFVYSLSSEGFFLGMRDLEQEGQWQWESDQSNVSWTNWEGRTQRSQQEPNGGRSENCALINSNRGKWADLSCNATFRWVVCEKSRTCHTKLTQCFFDHGIRNIIMPDIPKLCNITTRRLIETCVEETQCDSTEEHQEESSYHLKLICELCKITTINFTNWEPPRTQRIRTCKNHHNSEVNAVKQAKRCEAHIIQNANRTEFCRGADAMFACFVNDVAEKCGPEPYSFYVREIRRASNRASKATLTKKYTEPPYSCMLNIPEEEE